MKGETVLMAPGPIKALAPWGKGMASHPEGRVAAMEETDLGQPPGTPRLLTMDGPPLLMEPLP